MNRPTIRDRLTPSRNVHHLTQELPPQEATTRIGRKISLSRSDTYERQRLRSRMSDLQDIDYSPLDQQVSSWEELQEAGIEVFEHHVKTADANMSPEAKTAILHAGTAGAGVIGAFLRVIPELASPHDEIPTAKKSVRTMMTWAAFSADADEGLTYLVCNPKPNLKLHDKELYTGLTFDPSYFAITEPQLVELNYDQLDQLKKDDAKRIDRQLQGNDVYFGCPFRAQIPKFYKVMTNTAIRSLLLK